ncbi:UBA-e1-C domain-containing protein [Mycena sanguinolenta]|uniref:UBA-e1-C domain-containing protein n=1 Tax=Mycena sanguinolenta TaxID=230812 RepID=A0A8H6XED4_9AGAR|nr:UBA-e1-C domain-containing protein [Mycena sanguinolenta]
MSYSSQSSADPQDTSQLIPLVIGNLIPLHVVREFAGLTWILHDYFITLEDEIRYIWPQRLNFSKFMFLWVRGSLPIRLRLLIPSRRYGITGQRPCNIESSIRLSHSIALLLFDVIQIHVFARPGITSNNLCVAMDTIIRVVGAVSLWSVEIIMQLRIYALYACSKRIAAFNVILFLGSIVGFMWILIYNHSRRASVIANVIHLGLPGCPDVHSGIEWAQWVPATIYEGILFGFALYRTFENTLSSFRKDGMVSLYTILLRDNILYFFGIAALLVFNNLMVVSVTHIPWFSYGPFHAAVGIMTTRMLINLRKATATDVVNLGSGIQRSQMSFTGSNTLVDGRGQLETLQFNHAERSISSMV